MKSYTLNETSCVAPGPEIPPPFPAFKIREREFAGVTIYPAYPCDANRVCDADNDSDWSLVVVKEDLDQVSMGYTVSEGNSCLLFSHDLVIAAGAAGEVVLRSQTWNLITSPYDARTCTPENAQKKRGSMTCVRLLQLVGARDEGNQDAGSLDGGRF